MKIYKSKLAQECPTVSLKGRDFIVSSRREASLTKPSLIDASLLTEATVGKTDAESEAPILRPMMQRVDSLGETLMLGNIEGRRRRGDRGWDGWMASSAQRTRVWANSGRLWRTGKPGVIGRPWGHRVRHGWIWTATKGHEVFPVITHSSQKYCHGNKSHLCKHQKLSHVHTLSGFLSLQIPLVNLLLCWCSRGHMLPEWWASNQEDHQCDSSWSPRFGSHPLLQEAERMLLTITDTEQSHKSIHPSARTLLLKRYLPPFYSPPSH